MTGIAPNKTALNSERQKLTTYAQFLPSLELKRDQLLAERNHAAGRLARIDRDWTKALVSVGEDLPMLAGSPIPLDGLVSVRHVHRGSERRLGLDLPVLQAIDFAVADYGFLTTPHWVDAVVTRLQAALRLALNRQLEEERLAILERALKKVNQRINLFEKVLIPETRQRVKRIQIALADADKAAVVRAKLAKAKRLERRPA